MTPPSTNLLTHRCLQYAEALAIREELPNSPRLDRLFYDLKYAVDLLDEYSSLEDEQFEIGSDLPDLFSLDPATDQPVRLDTCQVGDDHPCNRGGFFLWLLPSSCMWFLCTLPPR